MHSFLDVRRSVVQIILQCVSLHLHSLGLERESFDLRQLFLEHLNPSGILILVGEKAGGDEFAELLLLIDGREDIAVCRVEGGVAVTFEI